MKARESKNLTPATLILLGAFAALTSPASYGGSYDPPPLTAEMVKKAYGQFWTAEDEELSKIIGNRSPADFTQDDIDQLYNLLNKVDLPRYAVKTAQIYTKFGMNVPSGMPEYLNARLAVAKILNLYKERGEQKRFPIGVWPIRRYVKSRILFMSGYADAEEMARHFSRSLYARLDALRSEDEFQALLHEAYPHIAMDPEILKELGDSYFGKRGRNLFTVKKVLDERDSDTLIRDWHSLIHSDGWNLEGRKEHSPCLDGNSRYYARSRDELVRHFLLELGPEPYPMLIHRLFAYNPVRSPFQKPETKQELLILSFEALKMRYGEEAALAPLLKALKDENPRYRQQAAEILGALGLRARGARDALLDQLAVEKAAWRKDIATLDAINVAAADVIHPDELRAKELRAAFIVAKDFGQKGEYLSLLAPYAHLAPLPMDSLMEFLEKMPVGYGEYTVPFLVLAAEGDPKKLEPNLLQRNPAVVRYTMDALMKMFEENGSLGKDVTKLLIDVLKRNKDVEIQSHVLVHLTSLEPFLGYVNMGKILDRLNQNLPVEEFAVLSTLFQRSVAKFPVIKNDFVRVLRNRISEVFDRKNTSPFALGLIYVALSLGPEGVAALPDAMSFMRFEQFFSHAKFLSEDQVVRTLVKASTGIDSPAGHLLFGILTSPIFRKGNPWYKAIHKHLPPEELPLDMNQFLTAQSKTKGKVDPDYAARYVYHRYKKFTLLTLRNPDPKGPHIGVSHTGFADRIDRQATLSLFTDEGPGTPKKFLKSTHFYLDRHARVEFAISDGERAAVLSAKISEDRRSLERTLHHGITLPGATEQAFPRSFRMGPYPVPVSKSSAILITNARYQQKLRSRWMPAWTLAGALDPKLEDAVAFVVSGGPPAGVKPQSVCNLLLVSEFYTQQLLNSRPREFLKLADSCKAGNLWLFHVLWQRWNRTVDLDPVIEDLMIERLKVLPRDPRTLAALIPLMPRDRKKITDAYREAFSRGFRSDDQLGYLADFAHELAYLDLPLQELGHLFLAEDQQQRYPQTLDALITNPRLDSATRKIFFDLAVREGFEGDLTPKDDEQRKLLRESLESEAHRLRNPEDPNLQSPADLERLAEIEASLK